MPEAFSTDTLIRVSIVLDVYEQKAIIVNAADVTI